jgi:hypothetical protein
MHSGEIIVPAFQRKFVWKPRQSSRLIESFLLGLPVPPIFLFTREDGKQLVVDGQQRLKSITYFFNGVFEPNKEEFSLVGIGDDSPYAGKTYSDIESTDPVAFRKLNDSVLRSLVIKQLNPKGDTSIYHVFERLNTGGTSLVGQEIRNCIYHGPFNDLLLRLNNPPAKRDKLSAEWKQSVSNWRSILGKPKPDARLRDVELILRFMALNDDLKSYEKPMKDFLSNYMNNMTNADAGSLAKRRDLFQGTVNAVYSFLGARPFHIHTGLNAAVYDSVFVAFASNLNRIPSDIKKRFSRLIRHPKYLKCVTAGTTDEAIIPERMKIAKKLLFGK